MRKVSILIIVLLYTTVISAQPNGGFENWTTEFSYESPDGWQSLNFLSLATPPNPISVFKAIGTDKHSGNYALKIKSIHINNSPLPDSLNSIEIGDTGGVAFTGLVNLSPAVLTFGFPYTSRPEKLQFWSKYNPVGSDSAMVIVFLKKWNGLSTDTIAYKFFKFGTTLNYTFFDLPIIYNSNDIPDSAFIGFFSSAASWHARVNSTLFVDDVAFTGWVGLDEGNTQDNELKVYPNPAKGIITLSSANEDAEMVLLRDLSGRQVFKGYLEDKKANIDVDSFPAGTYLYEILDYNSKVLHRGRFNVTK